MDDRQSKRGSEKLLQAWQARALTEASVREIAAGLDATRGTVVSAQITGGERATGMTVGLTYDGDDVPYCGNDIQAWLKWHRHHGGGPISAPRILIKGIPVPDVLHLELDFGQVGPQRVDAELGALAPVTRGVR